jgi:formylglycine-generating enzyme required for sulfatase activity
MTEGIKKRWAFLVGINHYVEPSYGDLEFCVNDVQALAQWLEQELAYEPVVCLHDQAAEPRYEPTRNNIETELALLCELVGPDDLLLVHFACHGIRVGDQPYLITTEIRAHNYQKRVLPVAEIEQQMRDSGARCKVLLLDACHTGVKMARDLADPEFLRHVYEQAEGFALIAASTAQQKAFEFDGHGLFTHHLIQALLGQADEQEKGFVTVKDVEHYVLHQIKTWNQQTGMVQTPTSRIEGFGDMILAYYPDPITSPPKIELAGINYGASKRPQARKVPAPESTSRRNSTRKEFLKHQLLVQREEPLALETDIFQYFTEDIGNGLRLDMILIPGGSFAMGSPDAELERRDNEGPQHSVTVSEFFMSRYPITQAQWRAVALMDQMERKLDTDPSRFKGNDRPVDQVSWYDATEFCQRLTLYTGRTYRFPSEAEWEYACRARTTTPFCYGKTLTPDIANYNATYSYEGSPNGEYRQETVPVGIFPPNAFGLYDMHGNVWEWCQDYYHDSYKGAPTDGSAWVDDGNSDRSCVLRGGAWFNAPRICRSACRMKTSPESRSDLFSFRVVGASIKS